jgi:NADPH:quinone reductase-like Zn-dependent oxidoreductase
VFANVELERANLRQVFGFSFEEQKKKAYQEFVTVAETSVGKVRGYILFKFHSHTQNFKRSNSLQLPEGFTLQEAITLPNNVVTIFHAVTADLSLPLPWPRPVEVVPLNASSPILIWGGASSCGQYALQILSHWGYKNLLTTASPLHHPHLRSLGAAHVFDYRHPLVASQILEAAVPSSSSGTIPFILDCIGSKSGSLATLAKIAKKGTKVAVLLPVIVRDATDEKAPEYSMDVQSSAEWEEGVETRGVRTHFYAEVGDCFFMWGEHSFSKLGILI